MKIYLILLQVLLLSSCFKPFKVLKDTPPFVIPRSLFFVADQPFLSNGKDAYCRILSDDVFNYANSKPFKRFFFEVFPRTTTKPTAICTRKKVDDWFTNIKQ